MQEAPLMSASETYARWRTRLIPDHVVGEILSKNWIDNAIPFLILVVTLAIFWSLIPDFLGGVGVSDQARELGEILFVVLAMTVVMLAGGIDLSVGSTFALSNFVMLAMFNWLGYPVWVAAGAALLSGAAVGLVNGVLVGYLRLRAFLTTLVTLIIVRAIDDTLVLNYSIDILLPTQTSEVWNFVGGDGVFGIPVAFLLAAVVAIVGHVFLTRLRPGWHILAVGGSRRSAHNAGINVRRTVAITYVMSGLLAAAGGIFYASRLASAGASTGVGLEVTALTAAVLGGISLGGGRGSIAKAVLGAIIVLIITNSLVRIGLTSGANTMVLGIALLIAVAIDVRWLKNRHKVLSQVYVSPTYFKMVPCPSTEEGSDSPYALNDKLRDVELIGLGEIDGCEDPLLDRDDNIYFGNRQGDIIRYFGPDHKRWEVYAHIGGAPLGMAFDRDGNLTCCVAGMGLYQIRKDTREVVKLADETNRSPFSIIDDSRIRYADDLDIAPDGRVFFSEGTIRFDPDEWMVDALEGRGNGRILCYDPRDKTTKTVVPNLRFPNGVCVAHDGKSVLFATTWGCSVERYWLEGPKAGNVETLITNLPGYADNINRASDGTYWLAIVGMRTPVFDLALRKPGFRKRMVQRVAQDEWLFPQMNVGNVVKFTEQGKIVDCLWDKSGVNHPMLTSCNEHKGYLYLGGIYNNRVGKYKIPGADPNFTNQDCYWGQK
ncbi:ABC transporter [Mesorhizobium plurifarium]|uniref:ABC transporter n=1 Tax=Mesorhizobium plurifarium TaxID=69974 RepID=A0A0K2W0U7_MESPL|nr:ABC transporter [Mesorhizobium plurifarium]